MPELSLTLRTFSAGPVASWRPVVERALLAERAGIDRAVVPDHVVFGEHLEAYGRAEAGGRDGATQPTGPDGLWLEPMTTLSVIAGATSRVRLGTAVLLAALRRPVVLAKAAATLDALSEGRLDLGVGVGWQREEYEAAGLDYERRGRLLDHTLEVCQTLWREPRAAYDSPELRFEGIHLMPKPRRAGGIPIWVSGTVNTRVARRIARFGSGWIPWGADADNLATALPRMKELLAAAGGDPSALQVVGGIGGNVRDLEREMAAVPALIAAGVSDFRVRVTDPDGSEASLDTLSAVVRAFRDL